jgi:hypothetical protein
MVEKQMQYVVRIFKPGTILGRFGVRDNPAVSSVAVSGNLTEINIPLDFAVACVKAAGYKVYLEV